MGLIEPQNAQSLSGGGSGAAASLQNLLGGFGGPRNSGDAVFYFAIGVALIFGVAFVLWIVFRSL